MKAFLALSGTLLCGLTVLACATDPASEPQASSDEQAASTSTTDDQASDALTISPKACFIEGFCGNPPSYCVHSGPCAQGEAATLALAYCRNHCGNCGVITERAPCP